METKIVNFFRRHRLLDGYIGVLGMVLHYNIMATYGGTWLKVFCLSLRKVFSISIIYHIGGPRRYYPRMTFAMSIFSKQLFDTGAKAAKEISDSLDVWAKERRAIKDTAIKSLSELGENAVDLAETYASNRI